MSTTDVDAWLATTQNPKRDVIAFLHGGIMAYLHWSAKEFASLIFPLGSRIPGNFDLLQGAGLQRMIRFHHLDDRPGALTALVSTPVRRIR